MRRIKGIVAWGTHHARSNWAAPIAGAESRRTRRRGVTAVEFAVAAPIALGLVFFSFEFGRMNMVRHTIQDAAYEAARRGLVATATETEIKAVATSIMNASGIRNATTTVAQTNDDVSVTISLNCNDQSWIGPLAFQGKSFSRSITLAKK
jgi:Flp pilus assembly protein TadG